MKKHVNAKENFYNRHKRIRAMLFRQRMQLIRILYGGNNYAGIA